MTIDEINAMRLIVREEVDQSIQPIRQEMQILRDDLTNKIDSVYKEVIDMRAEQSAHQTQHDDIRKDLDRILLRQ